MAYVRKSDLFHAEGMRIRLYRQRAVYQLEQVAGLHSDLQMAGNISEDIKSLKKKFICWFLVNTLLH